MFPRSRYKLAFELLRSVHPTFSASTLAELSRRAMNFLDAAKRAP